MHDITKALKQALEKIARWHGEFPESGSYYENGYPMSYGAAFGSNGERDYMRGVARDALEMLAAFHATTQPIDYTPGTWFNARTLDEMQAFYLSRLPAIREAAKEHGYAIGLHGSTRRDFDLMAMQWSDSAADKDVLAHAIAIAACGITRDGGYQWEKKPNGRFAVSIPICWTNHANPDFDKPSVGHIDLSVIDPTSTAQQSSPDAGQKDTERLDAMEAMTPYQCVAIIEDAAKNRPLRDAIDAAINGTAK